MKIYRLEKNNQGPYLYTPNDKDKNEFFNVYNSFYSKFVINVDLKEQPDIFDDIINKPLPQNFHKYLTGCLSKKDLKNWFGDYLLKLLKIGFNIKCYDIQSHNVLFTHSGKQIAFLNPKFL